MAIRAIIIVSTALLFCGCCTFDTSTLPIDYYDPDIPFLDIDLEVDDLPGLLGKKVPDTFS